MKNKSMFKADQFTFGATDNLYVAEASMLGLKPGEVLQAFHIDFEGLASLYAADEAAVEFRLVRTDKHAGEVRGWRYDSPAAVLHALIIND